MSREPFLKQLKSDSFFYMNTHIETLLQVSAHQSLHLHQYIDNFYDMIESKFSRFKENSELSALNAHAGELSEVSGLMFEVLSLSEKYRQKTQSIFNIFILNALEELGYKQSFEYVKNQHFNITKKVDRMDIGTPIQFLPDQSMILLNPFVHMDLGGIVKGWSTQKLSQQLSKEWEIERGFVNAGGDMYLWGGSRVADPWVVGIENPWYPEEDLGVIVLEHGCIATSSKLGRRWKTDKGDMHHIIDPRSMTSSKSSAVQCTVLGNDLVECEVWAKLFCILEIKEAKNLFRSLNPDIEALVFASNHERHFIGQRRSLYNTWEIDVDFVYDVNFDNNDNF